jgi:hypothetical protein
VISSTIDKAELYHPHGPQGLRDAENIISSESLGL